MEEKKLLKIESLLIVIVMLLQILLPIFPLSTISKAEGQEVESVQEIAGSGTVEDPWLIGKTNSNDVTAYLQETVLHIEGSGEMIDFESSNIPWKDIRNDITEIYIVNGVTNIGNNLFSSCTKITSITIPDSVRTIGDYAFFECTLLESITIPNSVETIGTRAFEACNKLTQVDLPSGVTNIGDLAFYDCVKLQNINVNADNQNYASENGILFNKDKTSLICYPQGKTETSYTIPDTVTSIENSAFAWCTRLTSVIIPGSVISIGDNAFYNCNSITEISIPEGTKELGEKSFAVCNSLTTVTISSTVESIGNQAFFTCSKLAEVNVNENNTNYLSESGILFNKNITKLIYYPRARENNSYEMPNTIESVEDWAFCSCSNLESITVSNNLKRIGKYAFYMCRNLTGITMQDGIKTIEEKAFYDCRSLESITIPNSIENVGEEAFNTDRQGLTTVNYYPTCNAMKQYVTNNQEANFTAIEIESISADTTNVKTTYTAGENLDLNNLVLTVTYVDETAADITEGYIVNPENGTILETVGTETVTITYEGKETSFNVTVNEATEPEEATLTGITIKTEPKKDYTRGEIFDITGLVVEIKYSDNTTRTVTENFTQENGFKIYLGGGMINPYEENVLDEICTNKVVTVLYKEGNIGKNDTYRINVAEKEVRKVEITQYPTREYKYGDPLSLNGLKLKVTYTDGTDRTITEGYTANPAAGTILTATTTVTISYGGKSTTYNVTVVGGPSIEKEVESISIKSKPKTTYIVGESLDLTGLVITVTYTDNTTEDITEGYASAPAEGTVLEREGLQTVTISYGGKTAGFTINVKSEVSHTLTGITIKTMPKTIYTVGERLDLRNMVISAQYSDGTSEDITRGYTSTPANGTVLNEAGTQTVTITYEEKQTLFDVTVNEPTPEEPTLTGISIKTLPKTVYTVGESLDLTGLVILATYSDGSTAGITTGYIASIAHGEVLDTAGKMTVTITYEGKITTFTITVNEEEVVEEEILTEESEYEEDGTYIENVLLKTSIDDFLANFNSVYTVTVSNENAEYIGTGMTVTIKKLENSVLHIVSTLEVVIMGDVTGDGIANISDIFEINKARLNTVTLQGAKEKAANMNKDSGIDFLDILEVNKLRSF